MTDSVHTASALLCNTGVVLLCVFMHYVAMDRINWLLPKLTILKQHSRVVVGVLLALVAHMIEIWLFGFVFYLMLQTGGFGDLLYSDGSLLDCVYFSLTSYSSLGYGDIEPVGHIRFLAGMEALTGLLLITWTASLMFVEMQRFWLQEQSE